MLIESMCCLEAALGTCKKSSPSNFGHLLHRQAGRLSMLNAERKKTTMAKILLLQVADRAT
jgi:hypothetical protein